VATPEQEQDPEQAREPEQDQFLAVWVRIPAAGAAVGGTSLQPPRAVVNLSVVGAVAAPGDPVREEAGIARAALSD